MNRRQFSGILPGVLAGPLLSTTEGLGQAPKPADQSLKPAPRRAHTPLPVLESGVFPLQEGKPGGSGRTAHQYLAGMLVTGNIRLESHVTTLDAGAQHETVDKHLHNEMWLMRQGTVELNINGVAHAMNAGDIGLVTAGDLHYVKNIGGGPASYFVVTLGPPE